MGCSSTICSLAVALLLLVLGASGQLQVGFYSKSCPSAESTVASVVRGFSASDSTILPALLRLQFHDCFVRVHLLKSACSVRALVDRHFHLHLQARVVDDLKPSN